MAKIDALVKVAISTRVLGTAFGIGIGALPGLLELPKLKGSTSSEKSRIIGKILLGAGIGGTLGNIGGLMLSKDKLAPNHRIFEQDNFHKTTNVGLKRILPGSIIGATPGIIQLTGISKSNTKEQNQDIFNKGFRKILTGGAIGGTILSQNNLFNRVSRGF
jgi:hypothetical protein